MNARNALMSACIEAHQKLRYRPDTVTTPDGVIVPVDVWGTIAEIEKDWAGDCDDYAVWTIERAARDEHDETGAFGSYWFVAGEVLVRGQWIGHAWIELVLDDGTVLWADPTWGEGPQVPVNLGYPETRRPVMRWHYAGGGIFDRQETCR